MSLGCFCTKCATGDRTELAHLLEARAAARRAEDWSTADHLRAVIEAAGLTLTDTPNGPVTVPLFKHDGWTYTP